MFFLNVLWQTTKRTWNSDMCTIQTQSMCVSVKQDQIVKEDFVIDKIKYAVHDNL